MKTAELESLLAALPKAELHLHLEGSIAPATVAQLAALHGVLLTAAEAAERYQFADFTAFLEAFKWVTSFLRTPADYGLITERLIEELTRQNVVYAEVTISAGVMLRRKQDVEANFAAIREAADRARRNNLKLQWIFDAVRQFGPAAAMEVARIAARLKPVGVVAFGLGGDELACHAKDFQGVFEFARSEDLHALAHAGEIGGPEAVRDAVALLGAERIGHGIAAARDPALIAALAEQKITLEICPTSNLRTGALARQLGTAEAAIEKHPLLELYARGTRIALATDDPAMLGTTLIQEYALASRLGLASRQLARLAGMSFEAAFLPLSEKESLLSSFRTKVRSLGLV